MSLSLWALSISFMGSFPLSAGVTPHVIARKVMMRGSTSIKTIMPLLLPIILSSNSLHINRYCSEFNEIMIVTVKSSACVQLKQPTL